MAAFGDGTIRWYRMTDGKELLAFFPHKDRKRWVMWTPGATMTLRPGKGADRLAPEPGEGSGGRFLPRLGSVQPIIDPT